MNDSSGRGMKIKSLGVRLALIGLLLLMSSLSSYAAPVPPDTGGFAVVKLPPEALMLPADFAPALSILSNPKMDSDLAALAAASSVAKSKALDLAQSQGFRLAGERVQVKITTHPQGVQAVTQAVAAVGGEVTGSANADTWLQAWIPVGALDAVAAGDDVYYISRPAEVALMATTEGLAVINGPAWQSAGFRGAGVKVAVIDGGFKGYPSLLGTDLPSSVVVKNFVDGESDAQVNGASEHGTACAEIVHDIAPDAALFLAKVNTDIDLQEAVTWLKDTQHVNIISTSLGWYNLTPGDGTGFFANLVQSARSAGIFWTTAAGNDREAHWGGAFSDPNSNGYHNFSGNQEVNFFGPGDGNAYLIPAGYPIRAFLRWDDWSTVNQNYDLLLMRWNGSAWQIIAQGNNPQNGGAGQTPTEFAAAITSGANTPYGFAVKRINSNRNVNLEIFAPKVARLDKIVPERSLANLADAPAAMTVAALDVNAPYPQESYSSEGPTNGPGGTAAGGAVKPEISGFANVSTVSYPDPAHKFNGTSAATPHVAGAAALVKNAYPAYTPAQIQSFLQGRAIDMGAPGKDTLFGYGRLNLGAPPVSSRKKAYLPVVQKPIPAPAAPVLNPINNADGDGNYAVIWNAVAGATSYTLQEDTNAGFTGPTTQYSGAGTSWNATGKAAGTFYYRVRAANASGAGGWSNTVLAVVQPPAGNGINGRVTFKGAAAAGIGLQLRFYDGSSWSTAATTTTDSSGRYRFTGAASLGAGQKYYVRFGPNSTNSAYLSGWWAPQITAYTGGATTPGGDFDIANVALQSPANNASVHLPAAFAWQTRGIATDTYRLELFDLDTGDGWTTSDLGNVGSVNLTGLPPGAVFDQMYGWDVLVFNGPDSYGVSYYYRRVTFLSGLMSAPAAFQERPMREGPAERILPSTQP